jgi:hypothetical protein
LGSYFIIKLVLKWLRKGEDPEEEINNRFYIWFLKYKVDLFLYLIMAVLIMKANLEVIYKTVSDSNLSSLERFASIDLIFVANVIVLIFIVYLNPDPIKRHLARV